MRVARHARARLQIAQSSLIAIVSEEKAGAHVQLLRHRFGADG
jgi:hypothetical protein